MPTPTQPGGEGGEAVVFSGTTLHSRHACGAAGVARASPDPDPPVRAPPKSRREAVVVCPNNYVLSTRVYSAPPDGFGGVKTG